MRHRRMAMKLCVYKIATLSNPCMGLNSTTFMSSQACFSALSLYVFWFLRLNVIKPIRLFYRFVKSRSRFCSDRTVAFLSIRSMLLCLHWYQMSMCSRRCCRFSASKKNYSFSCSIIVFASWIPSSSFSRLLSSLFCFCAAVAIFIILRIPQAMFTTMYVEFCCNQYQKWMNEPCHELQRVLSEAKWEKS